MSSTFKVVLAVVVCMSFFEIQLFYLSTSSSGYGKKLIGHQEELLVSAKDIETFKQGVLELKNAITNSKRKDEAAAFMKQNKREIAIEEITEEFRKIKADMKLYQKLVKKQNDLMLNQTIEIKAMRTQRDKLEKESRALKSNITELQSSIAQLRANITKLKYKKPTKAKARTIYIITPTYPREVQIAELTRLGQTLKLVPDLFWLVIEDANTTTPAVERLLERLGIPYVHLAAPMPERFLKKRMEQKPRGVSNRNRGLEWLRANATSGVFYFADDDNTYDIRIFEDIRSTKRVSMWPVGFLSKCRVASPVVIDGRVVGFFAGWIGKREFPVDMAAFAISVEFLLQRPQAKMPYAAGYEEDGFLKSLAPFDKKEIEPKASNCTEVWVWHTQTKTPISENILDPKYYPNTNLVKLHENIVKLGLN